MLSNSLGSAVSILLCCTLLSPGMVCAQDARQQPAQPAVTPQKYKLTVMEGASTSKRTKKGRVSSQAVVKVTDSNNVPVPGIAVTFTLPQLTGTGAAFTNGALTSIVTTNAAGVASSGSITAAAGSSFSVGVSASVPGGVITGTVPVTTAAAAGAGAAGAAGGTAAGAGAGGGISTGVIVGIAAAVVAGGVGAAVALKGKGGTTTPPPPATPTVSSPSTITFGAPK